MKTKYHNKQIETERCIFINAETLKGKNDPDSVRDYELSGEFTNEALLQQEQDNEIAQILKGKNN